MSFLRILLLSIVAAVVYGILHDQITARVCIEYFTIGHPRIIASESPTMLAFAWGVVATWWVGLILGVPLGLVARVGSWPKLTARRLIPALGTLWLVMSLAAATAGWLTSDADPGLLARANPHLAERLAPERHQRFVAVWAAHSTSYAVGFLGGLGLCVFTGWRRWRWSRTGRRDSDQPAAITANLAGGNS
jgi:hypothetical protein